jgi:hypothetical protein
MAKVFRIANAGQDDIYDFLTYALKPQNMTRTPNGDGWLTTTMTLVARNADADILSYSANLEHKAYWVEQFWNDPHSTNSIWLEESATSETTKRSLIKSIELIPLQVGSLSPLLGKTGALYTLTIIHSAAWEKTTTSTVSDLHVDTIGGILPCPAIDGSMEARISTLLLQGSIMSGDIITAWGGIRPKLAGDTDFNPLLELENGTLGAGAAIASDSDNASPHGSTDNVVTFTGTTDDTMVVSLTIDQATASTNYNHWVGDYQVLLRAKVSTGTIRLQLQRGYPAGTFYIPGPYVYYSTTDYNFIEMGTVEIPAVPRRQSAVRVKNFQFKLYALAMSGTPVLTADCLILIPSTHYFKVSGLALVTGGDNSFNGNIYEDGTISALASDTDGNDNLAAQYNPVNFTYPVEGGQFVLAAQQLAQQDVADSLIVGLTYYERYRTHGE